MSFLKKIFRKKKNNSKKTPAAETIDQLSKTLEMLETREKQLQQKISATAEKAKEYAKLKNKNAAIQYLKKKKLYEAQIQQLVNSQLRLHDQVIILESAKATHDTIDALKSGSAAVQALQQGLSIDEIQKVGEDTNENFESIKEIQDLLSNTVGISADFNEDDFETELEKLEVQILEEELPAARLHSDTVSKSNRNLDVDSSELPAAPLHPKAASQSINNVDTLSDLQSTLPEEKTGLVRINNLNELPATQLTQRRVSRSISNIAKHSSQLPETPIPRKTVSRSMTNVGKYSSHLSDTVLTKKTASQRTKTIDEFPQVPTTPITHNLRNMCEPSELHPAPKSQRTAQQNAA